MALDRVWSRQPPPEDPDDEWMYHFMSADGALSVTETEIVTGYMRYVEARKIAVEQRSENGERCVAGPYAPKPDGVVEAMLVQEIERLHGVLGVAPLGETLWHAEDEGAEKLWGQKVDDPPEQ